VRFTVQDLIKDRRKPVSVDIGDSAQNAVSLMMEHDFSQLPVVQQANKACGMVTSESILRAHASLGLGLEKLRVRDAMAKKPREFKLGDDLLEMFEYVMDSWTALVVDGDGHLTGIVTSHDTTEYLRARYEDMMLVEDVEMGLRDHLRAAYSGPNGPDSEALDAAAAELGQDKGATRGKFKNALKSYLAKSQGKLDDAAADEVYDAVLAPKITGKKFEALTFYEFIQMVLDGDKWKSHFQALFGIERAALRTMLERVNKTRNALAHFHGALDPAQRDHLRFSAEWLSRHPPPPPAAKPDVESAQAPTVTPPTPPEQEPSADNADRGQAEDFSSEDSKYAPLAAFLQSQASDRVEVAFAKVEELIGGPLPPSARRHPSWWANDSVGHVQSRQWLEIGWRVWTVSVAEEKVTFYRPTERGQAYMAFHNQLLADLEKAAPGLHTAAKPIPVNWVNVRHLYTGGGSKLGTLGCSFALRSRFRAELYIDSGDKERNKALFDKLHAQEQDIKSKLGEVVWERLDHRKASRIALYHPGSIDDDPKKLAALRAWGVESLKRLNEVLVPLLEAAGG
jgi:CBS domain-containing protein